MPKNSLVKIEYFDLYILSLKSLPMLEYLNVSCNFHDYNVPLQAAGMYDLSLTNYFIIYHPYHKMIYCLNDSPINLFISFPVLYFALLNVITDSSKLFNNIVQLNVFRCIDSDGF